MRADEYLVIEIEKLKKENEELNKKVLELETPKNIEKQEQAPTKVYEYSEINKAYVLYGCSINKGYYLTDDDYTYHFKKETYSSKEEKKAFLEKLLLKNDKDLLNDSLDLIFKSNYDYEYNFLKLYNNYYDLKFIYNNSTLYLSFMRKTIDCLEDIETLFENETERETYIIENVKSALRNAVVRLQKEIEKEKD